MFGFLITQAERMLGVRLEYLRYIAKVSPRLLYRFSKIFGLGNVRRSTPRDAFHVAALTVMLIDDCGECVQIAINMAKRDGVSPEILRAVVEQRVADLPEPLQVVHAFAASTITPAGTNEETRAEIVKLYGEKALVELALGTAAARVFPHVKRSLGYSQSCALVAPII